MTAIRGRCVHACLFCDRCVHACLFCGRCVHACLFCGGCVHACLFCGMCQSLTELILANRQQVHRVKCECLWQV